MCAGSFSRFLDSKVHWESLRHKESQCLTNLPGTELYWVQLGAGELILEQASREKSSQKPRNTSLHSRVICPHESLKPFLLSWSLPPTLSFPYSSISRVSMPRENKISTKSYLSIFVLWMNMLGLLFSEVFCRFHYWGGGRVPQQPCMINPRYTNQVEFLNLVINNLVFLK